MKSSAALGQDIEQRDDGAPNNGLLIPVTFSLHLPNMSLARSVARSISRQAAVGKWNPRFRGLATVVNGKPKLIDLSRELYHRSPAHPFHPPVCSA